MDVVPRSIQPLAKGFLSKKALGMFKKKKWFVLTGRRMKSFKNEHDYEEGAVFSECLDLMTVQAIRPLLSHGSTKNTFEIVTRSKSHIFQAESSEKMNEWVDALRMVMTQRFSSAGSIDEDILETRQIEHELHKRKSQLKFWRKSNSMSFIENSMREEDEDTYSSMPLDRSSISGSEPDQDKEDNNDIVFTEEPYTPDNAEQSVGKARPMSSSSGVGSVSTETASHEELEQSIPPQSEDEGISDTHNLNRISVNDDEDEPLYENFNNVQKPIPAPRISSLAMDELKKIVNYDDEAVLHDNTVTELKGIEQLKALLATLP